MEFGRMQKKEWSYIGASMAPRSDSFVREPIQQPTSDSAPDQVDAMHADSGRDKVYWPERH